MMCKLTFQTVRKQTLLLLESSGYPRDHDLFKELFSMVTKGTYFAFVSWILRHHTWEID